MKAFEYFAPASLEEAFGIPGWITGVAAAFVVGVVLLGGIRRISALAERLVPFMVFLYMETRPNHSGYAQNVEWY